MGDLLIYDFTMGGKASLLDSQTRVPGSVRLSAESAQSMLWLNYVPDYAAREAIDPLCESSRPNPQIVLLLKPMALHGEPDELRLELQAKRGGCRIALEAQDAGGALVRLAFGEVSEGERGIRGCALCPRLASSASAAPSAAAQGSPRFPLQFTRLFIELCDASQPLELGLARLFATGRVRLAAAGIAAGP